MTTATYETWSQPDPTETRLFWWAVRLERLIATFKFHFLIEFTRLLLLGFYEDFQAFLARIELEENRSENEAQFKAVFQHKVRAAERMEELVSHLDSLGNVPYKGCKLGEYLVGADRLEELKLFVRATALEREGEEILDQGKRKFLVTVTQRKLTPNQQSAMLGRYKELAELFPRSGEFPSA